MRVIKKFKIYYERVNKQNVLVKKEIYIISSDCK